ncbi:uncharacterized protein LOC127749590 [Frankliniella occidentalis]|uniref:Uncharacterized protein LOC127749590 n=1 Tax=Frankliniella occidentalis TaxID=133901 RepID=A0A9C6U338_FRAOC|nr:uncharacterized protein LOC127749590 [Frankliniella occidentalis]
MVGEIPRNSPYATNPSDFPLAGELVHGDELVHDVNAVPTVGENQAPRKGRRHSHVPLLSAPAGELRTSMAVHITHMQQHAALPHGHPDRSADAELKFRMQQSYTARHNWMWEDPRPTWQQVLEEYPLLKEPWHLKHEFERTRPGMWQGGAVEYMKNGKAERVVEVILAANVSDATCKAQVTAVRQAAEGEGEITSIRCVRTISLYFSYNFGYFSCHFGHFPPISGYLRIFRAISEHFRGISRLFHRLFRVYFVFISLYFASISPLFRTISGRGVRTISQVISPSAEGREEERDLWAAVACLPYLAKEDSKAWLVANAPLPRGQPCVVMTLQPGVGGSHVGATFKPYMDGIVICDEANMSMVECFEVLAQAIHIAGVEFSKKTKKCWWMLCEDILKVKDASSTSHLSRPLRTARHLLNTA